MKKKIKVIFLLLVGVLLLSSCIGEEMVTTRSDIVDAYMRGIVDKIEFKDKERLQAYFSKRALEENETIGEEIDALFAFIGDEHLAWKRDPATYGKEIETVKESGESEGGKPGEATPPPDRTIEFRPRYSLLTKTEGYIVNLVDYPVDTIDPDNEGLYMIEIAQSDYDGEWEIEQGRFRAGIVIHE